MPSAPALDETAGAFAVGHDGDAVPAALRGAILAIGNFDGVHRGHRALIEIAIQEGRERRGPAAGGALPPPPPGVFSPGQPPVLLPPPPAARPVFPQHPAPGGVVRPPSA